MTFNLSRCLSLPAMLAAALLLAGCFVQSTTPIRGGEAADPRLLGTFQLSVDESEAPAVIHALPAKAGGIDVLMIVHADSANDAGWSWFSGETAELGGDLFISLRERASDGETAEDDTPYTLIRAVPQADGRFTLFWMDETAAAAAVEAGEIAGEVSRGRLSTSVALAADAGALAAFIERADRDALFAMKLGTLTPVPAD